jgi:hypothetical protein
MPTKLKKVDPSQRLDQTTHKRVLWLEEQRQRYEQFWQPDLERFTINARALWGLNYGQWSAAAVQKLLDEGRRPQTYNILLDKAETFIGSVIGNGFEPRYSPAQGEIDSLTLKLQDMYYSDKSLMVWKMAELECLLDSSCGVGYESIWISDKFHSLGNIAFVKRNPRRILLDPSWKDSDPDNLRSYFTWTRMSVDEIMYTFPVQSERLKDLRARELRDGINYGENIGIADYQTAAQKWDDAHLITEFHWIDKKKRQWEYDKKNHCDFPETNYPFHSKEDLNLKMRYVQMMGLSQNDITFVTQNKVTKYIQAVCPSLDAEIKLIDGKDIVQVGNCNLFPLGMKMEGQYQGMVDRMIDLNRSINKGEMNIEDIQQRSAKGFFLLDKALTGGDPELEADIENAWNDAGGRAWVSEGSTADLGQHGGVIEMSPSRVSNDIFTQQQRRYSLADKFSKVPAAMESRTEFAGEPNSMFENKVAVGIIGQRFYMELFEMHKMRKAMAYARQAKITYSGATREFGGMAGQKPFKINRKKENFETGKMEILDDIGCLPEMKVTMIPSKDGINIRSQLRSDYSVILQAVQADPNNRLLTLAVLDAVLETTPLPDESKESFKRAIKLLQMQAALMVAASIKATQAQMNPMPQNAGQQLVAGAQQRAGLPQPPMEGNPENVSQQSSTRNMTDEEMRIGTPQQQTQPTGG